MPVTAERCPTCGAPLTLTADRACAFCHTPLQVTRDAPVAVAPAATAAAASAVAAVDPGGPFSMQVEDVFSIRGRGTVLTGKVASGTVRVRDRLVLDDGRTVKCAGVEMFRKQVDMASAGDFVGLLIEGQGKDPVQRGVWLRAAS